MNLILTHFNVFLLVTLRVVGFIVASPLISLNVWPNWAKIGLAFGVSYMVAPSILSPVPNIISEPGQFVVIGLMEAVIGLALGFIATMVFSVISIAGQAVDLQSGMSVASLLVPGSMNSSGLFGSLYNLLFTLYFLGMGGLDGLMLSILQSFRIIPVGHFHMPSQFPSMLLQLLGLVMTMAIELAAPLLVALFLSDVTFAFLSRAVPQMNVFVVGMPVKIFVALSMFAIVMPGTMYVFHLLFTFLFEQMQVILQSMGG